MADVEQLPDQLYDAELDGRRPAVEQIVQQLIAAGEGAETILYKGMIPAMNEVGRLSLIHI